jgi:elongation of very long chain fatty acids protein 4
MYKAERFFQIIMPNLPTVKGLYPFKFIYNIVQVMLCSYMCIEAGVRAYSAGYSLLPCNPFNQQNPPIGFIIYVFYLSKILDFLDTVFIILEKRWKQLSFLHVYHHTSIFLVSLSLIPPSLPTQQLIALLLVLLVKYQCWI